MNTGIAYAQMDSPVGPVWVAATRSGICRVGLGVGQPERFFDWLARHMGTQSPSEDAITLAPALTQLRE